jgi:hypothetical protein
MMYQLVLQFRGDSLADYNAMIALEDRLTGDLGHLAKVDGHDCGADETNIFIITSDPATTFWKIRHTLEQERRLQALTAAYRAVEGQHYTVLWPKDSPEEFTVK